MTEIPKAQSLKPEFRKPLRVARPMFPVKPSVADEKPRGELLPTNRYPTHEWLLE